MHDTKITELDAVKTHCSCLKLTRVFNIFETNSWLEKYGARLLMKAPFYLSCRACLRDRTGSMHHGSDGPGFKSRGEHGQQSRPSFRGW
jgi:hypothetical protein